MDLETKAMRGRLKGRARAGRLRTGNRVNFCKSECGNRSGLGTERGLPLIDRTLQIATFCLPDRIGIAASSLIMSHRRNAVISKIGPYD
jgi:hypothetical protein